MPGRLKAAALAAAVRRGKKKGSGIFRGGGSFFGLFQSETTVTTCFATLGSPEKQGQTRRGAGETKPRSNHGNVSLGAQAK